MNAGGTEANAFYIDDKIDVGNWTVTPGIRFERISTEWHDRPVIPLTGPRTLEKRREVHNNEPLPAILDGLPFLEPAQRPPHWQPA